MVSRGRADLHTHTTASDGWPSPHQLVDRARLVGLDVIAVTDCFPRYVLKPDQSDIFAGSPPFSFTYGLGGLVLFPVRRFLRSRTSCWE